MHENSNGGGEGQSRHPIDDEFSLRHSIPYLPWYWLLLLTSVRLGKVSIHCDQKIPRWSVQADNEWDKIALPEYCCVTSLDALKDELSQSLHYSNEEANLKDQCDPSA